MPQLYSWNRHFDKSLYHRYIIAVIKNPSNFGHYQSCRIYEYINVFNRVPNETRSVTSTRIICSRYTLIIIIVNYHYYYYDNNILNYSDGTAQRNTIIIALSGWLIWPVVWKSDPFLNTIPYVMCDGILCLQRY